MGPVVGVVAAAQVDLALALLDGEPVAGTLVTFDGRSGALQAAVRPGACGGCPLLRRSPARSSASTPQSYEARPPARS